MNTTASLNRKRRDGTVEPRNDVDMESRTLRVSKTVQRLGSQSLVTGTPKTMRSRRTIPLPARVLRNLTEHREAQDAERERAGSAWQDNGLVFASKSGSLLGPKHVNRILDSLAEKAGARRIRFHDLRHTCAPLLLGQGVAPRTVMEVLGHSQMSITTDLYGHVMLTTLRDAADAMDAALSAPASGNGATR